MVMVVPRPLTDGEQTVQKRTAFRGWLEKHTARVEAWEKENPDGKGNQSVPHNLIVVLEPDHPRYMQIGHWVVNDWRESGEVSVDFQDGGFESYGGDGTRGGVSGDKLGVIYVPQLSAYDGAFLEWVQPGVRVLIQKALEASHR